MQRNRNNRPWVAFYSHSGKELINLIEKLGYAPDLICTNNPKWHETPLGEYYWGKTNICQRIEFKSKWTQQSYEDVLEWNLEPLITLHGWMKIVPRVICEAYEIYNGHPALCDRYPDLKGKDQQEAVINQIGKYPTIGSIIHECTAELDSGKVVERREVTNFEVADRATIYSVLRDTSLYTWLNFLPKHLE